MGAPIRYTARQATMKRGPLLIAKGEAIAIRHAPSPFKACPSRAEGERMTGRLRPRAFIVGLLITTVLVTNVLTSSESLAGADRRARYAGGEAGSGMPAIGLNRSASVATATSTRWSDVTSEHAWARDAIDYVAGTEDWMRDFPADDGGARPFRPDALERRKHFARALVRAFARDESADPALSFTDVDPSSKFWRFANVVVSKGWLKVRDEAFRPDDPVTMRDLHRALVLARGLRPAVRSLNEIRTADGASFRVPRSFGTTVLGMRMNLRYPSKFEDHDVHPWTAMPRIQVAYSLHRAALTPASTLTYLLAQYSDVELPRMSDRRRAIVQWGIRFTGYPYVWGGEWGRKSAAPTALGGQSIPGFDCSGLIWWLMRRNDDGAWQVAPPRPYAGWLLPERTSSTMAAATDERLRYGELKPGDLMFYDGDDDGTVDHADVYAGAGWALDSSNSVGGVTLMWVGSGWYRDHFVFGRRILAG
jgi:hypothetical protein